MSTKVLVTGGSGFLGSHISFHLANRGDGVVIFDLAPPRGEARWLLAQAGAEVKFEKGSTEDFPSILAVMRDHRIEKVIHCAAIADNEFLRTHPHMALRVNIGGTLNVLEAARYLGLARVVFTSTNAVLTAKQYEPVDENHSVLLPEGPAGGFYAASKVSGEAFGLCYWVDHGLDFIALRPSGFYGLGMQVPLHIKPMIEQAVRGEPVRLARGGFTPRDYVYVEDTASAFLKALDVKAESLKDRIFLIGTGRPLSTPAEVAGIVKEALPGSVIEIEESAPDWYESKHRAVINIERARTQLGYEPLYDLRAGVKKYIAMYQEYLKAHGN